MNSTPSLPTYSILTPTWNRPDDLRRCIDSVLAQTHTDWEQIVYNVGDPVEIPDDPRIRYVTGERTGPAGDFQACLDLASGRIVHPLSDDDTLPPHALDTALARLGDREWLVAVTVGVRDGEPSFIRGGNRRHVEETRHGSYMLGGAIYWRRTLTDRLGGFNADFDGAADFDLYTRFLDAEEPAVAPDVLYLYNDHDGSDSRRNTGRQADATRRIAAARRGVHAAA